MPRRASTEFKFEVLLGTDLGRKSRLYPDIFWTIPFTPSALWELPPIIAGFSQLSQALVAFRFNIG